MEFAAKHFLSDHKGGYGWLKDVRVELRRPNTLIFIYEDREEFRALSNPPVFTLHKRAYLMNETMPTSSAPPVGSNHRPLPDHMILTGLAREELLISKDVGVHLHAFFFPDQADLLDVDTYSQRRK